MFEFAIAQGGSYLDLGCGFGRFLDFLVDNVSEPNYIGYDSSEAMLERLRARHPEYFVGTYLKNITDSIVHPQEVVVASAVFIHIPRACQDTVLENILNTNPLPKAITFDINSPAESEIDRLKIKQSDHYERRIKTTKSGTSAFRMTWQSHYAMTEHLLKTFTNYNLSIKFYELRKTAHKVVYFLEKK